MLNYPQLITIFIIFFVVILGIISRTIRTKNVIWNHYLGDALYAVMFYLLITLFWNKLGVLEKSIITFIIMCCFEIFQLTQIPMSLYLSENRLVRSIGILLGTKFEWLEIASYFVGILGIALLDIIF